MAAFLCYYEILSPSYKRSKVIDKPEAWCWNLYNKVIDQLRHFGWVVLTYFLKDSFIFIRESDI